MTRSHRTIAYYLTVSPSCPQLLQKHCLFSHFFYLKGKLFFFYLVVFISSKNLFFCFLLKKWQPTTQWNENLWGCDLDIIIFKAPQVILCWIHSQCADETQYWTEIHSSGAVHVNPFRILLKDSFWFRRFVVVPGILHLQRS